MEPKKADRTALRASRPFLTLVTSWWLALMLSAFAGPVSAQIQLVPPTVTPQAKDAQLSATPGASEATGPADRGEERPATEGEAPKPAAPPDFSVVDRATGTETAPRLEAWTNALNEIEETLNAEFISYTQLDRARGRLEDIRSEINDFLSVLTPKVEEAKAQVENLGPAPEIGEPEPVAAQRANLQNIFGSLTAVRNIAESTRLRSNQLTNTVQEIRRRKFTERLFERVPDTYSPQTWIDAPSQLNYALDKSWQIVSAWWRHLDRRGDAIQTLILTLLIAAGTGFISYRGVRHFRRWDEPGEPPFWRRSTSAAWVIILRVLPFAAVSAFVYYSFRYQGLMTAEVDLVAYSAMRSLLIFMAVSALIATALAPARPHWRLLPMDDRAALRIRWLVTALALVYGLTLFLDTVRYVSNAPFMLTIAQSFVSSLIIAALVIAILKTPRNAPEVEGAPEFAWIGYLRWPLWGAAFLILLTALSGFIGLARFVSAQLIVTGAILAFIYLLMLWVDAVGQSIEKEDGQIGGWLKEKAGLDQRRREQFALPATLVLKLGSLIVTMPLVLLQWGFDARDILQWGENLLFGFRIGDTEISLAAILAAIFVFIIGYLIARFFQGWLDRRVLTTAGISGGTRNSIKTAVGYIGVIIAGLFAISYAGLDLSNIALVAGALSVGIGLGLQGVVNNFVSGLILLVERPIKAGDWVIVGGEEGIVKKISVRSTEIETFERSTVIIPNSYFISEKVKNWTLHNYSGRIHIAVGVHYDSDPRRVKDLLLDIAKAHPQVMTNPEPCVYFEDFGADALNFSLYAYTYDITKSLGLRTDLRIAIMEAFRKEGIDIPYRQTDVHLQGLDWLKDILAGPSASVPADLTDQHRQHPAAQGQKAPALQGRERAHPVPMGTASNRRPS